MNCYWRERVAVRVGSAGERSVGWGRVFGVLERRQTGLAHLAGRSCRAPREIPAAGRRCGLEEWNRPTLSYAPSGALDDVVGLTHGSASLDRGLLSLPPSGGFRIGFPASLGTLDRYRGR